MKTVLLALVGLSLATSASASTVANPLAQDKAVLQLKGLDLSTAEGQQRLAIRLDQAARAVCGDRLATVHLALDAQASDCRSLVVADVRAQIESRLAAASTGTPVTMASAR